jgi:hypothetical protein
MHLSTPETIKRIQEERLRRSLANHKVRKQHRGEARPEIAGRNAVVIELDLAEPREATHPIGA